MREPDPHQSSEQTAAEETNRQGSAVLPPWLMFALALLPVAAPWVLFFLGLSPSQEIGLLLYLAHWAAVGGLIGFALSKGRFAIMLGAILGVFLAVMLRC